MKNQIDDGTPEPLQGLGLTKDQLKLVQRYFALRVHHARKQRYTLLAAFLALVSCLVSKSLLDDSAATRRHSRRLLATSYAGCLSSSSF